MSEPTSLNLARTWLKRAEESTFVEQELERLRYAMGSIVAHLTHLESHPQPQAAPESRPSGSTSPESAGASPEATTASTPATGTMVLTSSHSPPSPPLVDWGDQTSLLQPSKTSAPTSSTPSTDRSTGPSAQSGELHPYFRNPAFIVPAEIPSHEIHRFDGRWVSIQDYKELLAAYDKQSSIGLQ